MANLRHSVAPFDPRAPRGAPDSWPRCSAQIPQDIRYTVWRKGRYH